MFSVFTFIFAAAVLGTDNAHQSSPPTCGNEVETCLSDSYVSSDDNNDENTFLQVSHEGLSVVTVKHNPPEHIDELSVETVKHNPPERIDELSVETVKHDPPERSDEAGTVTDTTRLLFTSPSTLANRVSTLFSQLKAVESAHSSSLLLFMTGLRTKVAQLSIGALIGLVVASTIAVAGMFVAFFPHVIQKMNPMES